jgi:Flp pilus assembly protein TadG
MGSADLKHPLQKLGWFIERMSLLKGEYMKSRFFDTHGGALVEVALSAPLLVLMTLGAFELGRVAHFAIEVENAARAGASYGSVNIGNANSVTVTQAAKNDAPDLGTLTATPGSTCVCETLNTSTNTATFYPTSGTVSCSDSHITGCTAESSTSVQIAVSYVTVSTQATLNSVFHVGPLPASYTVHGFSVLRVLPN